MKEYASDDDLTKILDKKEDKEALEISSTGYGLESVSTEKRDPLKNLRKEDFS